LKNYERRISDSYTYWSVSLSDAEYYQAHYSIKEVINIPVFLPWIKVDSLMGIGSYCLYHGNLSVSENEKVVVWLVEKIFSQLNIPFVIAGKDPSTSLKKISHQNRNICIIENPSEYELDDLIKKAQLNILPSFNTTGVKLKILHALFHGRHCIVNASAIDGSGLNELVHIINRKDEFITLIQSLFSTPFTDSDKMKRMVLLKEKYNNEKNADKIIELIW
jgi:glycosyltransferase involved in cell wall biosynthesis